MITLYHLGVSQSDRIVWLLEELELPYELQWFDRGANGLAQADYRALHPVATAPTIRDGELVLCDSHAAVEYIVNRYAGGRPPIARPWPSRGQRQRSRRALAWYALPDPRTRLAVRALLTATSGSGFDRAPRRASR